MFYCARDKIIQKSKLKIQKGTFVTINISCSAVKNYFDF